MHATPISFSKAFSWDASRAQPIEECGEALIPISYCPDLILSRPQYFYQGLSGSLPETYLREGVCARLVNAARLLPAGHRFVVFDGWRPMALQKELFLRYRQELAALKPGLDERALDALTKKFVALPDSSYESPSPHSTGGSVDLSIADDAGRLLPMGAEFDETTERSRTTYFEEQDGAEDRFLKNRRILFHVMTAAGFTNYPDEWWHFDYGNQNWALMSGQGKAIYGSAKPALRWM